MQKCIYLQFSNNNSVLFSLQNGSDRKMLSSSGKRQHWRYVYLSLFLNLNIRFKYKMLIYHYYIRALVLESMKMCTLSYIKRMFKWHMIMVTYQVYYGCRYYTCVVLILSVFTIFLRLEFYLIFGFNSPSRDLEP